ncbi:unnamed protein product [Ectocarpus sp. 6 AP-2014]
MHAKGATLRALWLTAAVATAISGPRSSASASTGASSSAFVGAAAATVAPLEPFHVRAPHWGARSSPTPRSSPSSSSSSSSSSMSMAFASAARETQRQQKNDDLLQRPHASPVAAAVAPKNTLPLMGKALFVTGGGAGAGAAGKGEPAGFGVASAWGVVSVVFILMNAVKRLAPIALQPFSRGDFTTVQWAMYAGFSALMAYAEGFKGFQKKFSPLVVKRALTLDPAAAADPAAGGGQKRRRRAGPLRLLLAGPYSMGLFHATKKRKTMVKRLPYPWRSIVDAGVVVGLSYGTLSICVIWARAILGKAPSIDPALPEEKK